MALSGELPIDAYTLAVDQSSVWLHTNMRAGSMAYGYETPDAEVSHHREQALALLGMYAAASQTIRMRPPASADHDSFFVDLDATETQSFDDVTPLRTEAIFTTSANHILSASPADCAELAVVTTNQFTGETALGLIHAGSQNVRRQGHIKALNYFVEANGVTDLSDVKVHVSPSIRKASYTLQSINDSEQRASERWAEYIAHNPKTGNWHIDLHGRTVADLKEFGLPTCSLRISEVDTAVPGSTYYSHRQYMQDLQPHGYNGLFLARANSQRAA